jgi:leucyl aminopeptidase
VQTTQRIEYEPLVSPRQKISLVEPSQKRKTQSKGAKVKVLFVGRGEKVPAAFYKSAPSSIKAQIKKKTSMVKWSSSTVENWLFQMQVVEPQNHYGRFTPSPYSMARDLVGTGFKQIFNESPQSITVDHIGQSDEEFLGLCVGMELAHYQFKKVWPQPKTYQGGFRLNTRLKKSAHLLNEGSLLGEAVNFSRFLVDLPPNLLQHRTYAELLRDLFAKKPKTKVTLWNQQRLEKEEMGLHVAVGQAASQEPHMVHIQYRGGGQEKPLAFVGKGVTFDAGGLDIKPAANMRLMKKDMGGSASVAGLAYWSFTPKLKSIVIFILPSQRTRWEKNPFVPAMF